MRFLPLLLLLAAGISACNAYRPPMCWVNPMGCSSREDAARSNRWDRCMESCSKKPKKPAMSYGSGGYAEEPCRKECRTREIIRRFRQHHKVPRP